MRSACDPMPLLKARAKERWRENAKARAREKSKAKVKERERARGKVRGKEKAREKAQARKAVGRAKPVASESISIAMAPRLWT